MNEEIYKADYNLMYGYCVYDSQVGNIVACGLDDLPSAERRAEEMNRDFELAGENE